MRGYRPHDDRSKEERAQSRSDSQAPDGRGDLGVSPYRSAGAPPPQTTRRSPARRLAPSVAAPFVECFGPSAQSAADGERLD